MSPIRVVIADDEMLVRQGLRRLLELSPKVDVVADASDGEQAVATIERERPDVVLLDVRMPKKNGVEVLRTLAARGALPPALLLTTFDDAAVLIDGIRAGDVDLGQRIRQTQASAPKTPGRYSGVEIINDGVPMTNQRVKEYVSRYVPSIVYGTNASTVISANLSTKNDPLLVASQLTGLNKNKQNTMEPNGSGLGGLPLRVIPGQLNMTLQGNPLVNYAQMYFVEFTTGTSLDNVYGITGLTHVIQPGRFTTDVTFGFYDAYGRFESSSNVLEEIAALSKPIPTK